MKKKTFKLLYVVIGILIAMLILVAKEYIFTKDKLQVMRNDLLYNYYDEEKLTAMLKDELGDAYEGNLRVDLDNFVISVVMNELAQYETEENERYNTFFSKSQMKNFQERREEEALKTDGYSLADNIYYLNIDQTLSGITYKQIQKHFDEMKDHGNLIIDLRDNNGGDLDEMNKMISMFLDKGTHMYSMQMRNKLKKEYAEGNEKLEFEKIVILMNDMTASASELFIISLRENLENVTLLGETTYGKDIFYGVRKFQDQSGMLFITSVMQGPKGTNYDDGISADPIHLSINSDEADPLLALAVKYIQE